MNREQAEKKAENLLDGYTWCDTVQTIVTDLLMREAELEWYKIWFEKLCGTATTARVREIWTDLEQQLSSSQKRVEELERALRIESSEPEERSQESAHYNWLDDKNEELEKRIEELENEVGGYAEAVRNEQTAKGLLRKELERLEKEKSTMGTELESLKQSQGKVLIVEDIKHIIFGNSDGCGQVDIEECATAIHKAQKGE